METSNIVLGNIDNFSYIGSKPNRKVMQELWMKAKGYEDYLLVSSEGRVMSTKGKLRKLVKHKLGYLQVCVFDSKKGLKKNLSVHRLVAETFIPNLYNKPNVCHWDNNKSNCNVNNLYWGTQAQNIQQAYDDGLIIKGENHINSKLTEKDVLFIRNSNSKGVELANKFNVTPQLISKIKKKRTWKHLQ